MKLREVPENSYVVMPKGSKLKELPDGRCVVVTADGEPVMVGKNSIIHSAEYLESIEEA